MSRSNLALALAPVAPLGCKECAFVKTCGGLEQQAMWGCFAGCGPCGVADGKCDYSCPRKPGFFRDWAEVGGLEPKQRRVLPQLELELPRYIPMIRHGSSRDEMLPSEVVALNTFEVVDSMCRTRDANPLALRERFRIAPNASVLLISVKQDRFVEAFWAHRDTRRLAALAAVGAAAITTPNFSFFDDAPRLHSVRNLWRIVRTAEELADAGMTPIPHVNATCHEDWKMWALILRESGAVRHVCKEFQTGLADPARAADAVAGLRWLQDSLGRPLHPIIVGGRRVAGEIARHFSSFTIVDSVPFIATMKRKRLLVYGASVSEVDSPTAPGEMLDELLQANVRAYGEVVELCALGNRVHVSETLEREDDP